MLKQIVKRIARTAGYDIIRHPDSARAREHQDPDVRVARALPPEELYDKWTTPLPVYLPWNGAEEFTRYYDEQVAGHTLVSADRCYMLLKLAQHAARLDGDFAECGVFRGGTSLLVARVLADTGKSFYLFDSFEGLSQPDDQFDNYYKQGDFAHTSPESIRQLLGEHAGLATILKGWVPQTFAEVSSDRFAYVHVDVDLYDPALACCRFFHDRLVPGGVLIFDDYGFPSCRGERHAVDQFFADQPESPIVLPTGQAIVIKVGNRERPGSAPFPPASPA